MGNSHLERNKQTHTQTTCRQLCPMLRSVTHEAARRLVQAFMSSRLDYCNSLFYGVSQSLIRKVQSIQNAAALGFSLELDEGNISRQFCVTRAGSLPRGVNLKLACFVFSSLSGQAPRYLADDTHLVSEGPRRRICSSTDRSCTVPRTNNTFGDGSFAPVRSSVCNSLPAHLRDDDITYNSFRREPETYWF